MHDWKFWRRKPGIGIVKCFRCKAFIESGVPGEVPKITRIYWSMCEACQNKERGIIGARRPDETGMR